MRRRTLLWTLVLGLTLLAATAAAPAASEPRAATGGAPAVLGTAEARRPDSLRLLHAWLAAFNSGDRERYGRFLARNWPRLLPSLDFDMGLRDVTGGFVLRRVQRASTTRVSGWLQERDSDQFFGFAMRVSAAKRPTILGMDYLLAIPRPAAFPIPRLTEREAIAGAEALLRKRAAEDRFSGAALVANGGQVVFAEAYGLADRERAIANTVETRFRVASIAKMFTAVATLQLVEADKLALDDPVGEHLRDYPNQEVATKVTVRHLLTHTGGTGDIFGPGYDQNRLQLREHSEYVKLFGSRPPAFEPGTQFAYSNYGFVLLGAIIEAVSGESYYDYVREHVFRPAGMTSTDSLPDSAQVPNRSIGYTRPFPGSRLWWPNTDRVLWRGNAAGDAYSTVGDLLRFAGALTSNRLLSSGSTQMLMRGKWLLFPGARIRYGFGFEDARDKDGNGWVGHPGGGPGINGELRIYPKSGYVVAVLANLDWPAASRIADYLDPRLPSNGS